MEEEDIVDDIRSRSSVLLTAILSIIFPGLGHMYIGEEGKGIKLLIVALIGIILTFVIIGAIVYAIVWIYALYDSVTSVYEGELFKSDEEEPTGT